MSELAQEKIDGWKKEYGRVFQCKIADKTYVYRTLKRGEFLDMQKKLLSETNGAPTAMSPLTAAKLEEEMVKSCVLYPEDLDIKNIDAGAPAILATYISDVSGFTVDEEPIAL